MTLFDAAPREVYRVYDEEEFSAEHDCDEPLHTVSRGGSSGHAVAQDRRRDAHWSRPRAPVGGADRARRACCRLQAAARRDASSARPRSLRVSGLDSPDAAQRWREYAGTLGQPGRASVGHRAQPRAASVRRAAVRARRTRRRAGVTIGRRRPRARAVRRSCAGAAKRAGRRRGTSRRGARSRGRSPRQPRASGAAEFGFER